MQKISFIHKTIAQFWFKWEEQPTHQNRLAYNERFFDSIWNSHLLIQGLNNVAHILDGL
jgi:hypothetical protein